MRLCLLGSSPFCKRKVRQRVGPADLRAGRLWHHPHAHRTALKNLRNCGQQSRDKEYKLGGLACISPRLVVFLFLGPPLNQTGGDRSNRAVRPPPTPQKISTIEPIKQSAQSSRKILRFMRTRLSVRYLTDRRDRIVWKFYVGLSRREPTQSSGSHPPQQISTAEPIKKI